MPDSDPTQPFYLIVTDPDRGVFSVEGRKTDDRPWESAARYACDHERRITCGPIGSPLGRAGGRVSPWEKVGRSSARQRREATRMTEQLVHRAGPSDAEWISGFLRERWHDTTIVAHVETINAAALPALIAYNRQGPANGRG
jgi:hypothetical protein